MKTQSIDTTPEAEQVQIEALRRLGPRGRIAQMCSLTQMTRRFSLRALRRTRPDLNEEQLMQEWIKLIYGEQLIRSLVGEA